MSMSSRTKGLVGVALVGLSSAAHAQLGAKKPAPPVAPVASSSATPPAGAPAVPPPGTIDTTFDPKEGFTGGVVAAIAVRPDKIAVGGTFSVYRGLPRRGIAVLRNDGQLDPEFAPSPDDKFDGGGGGVRAVSFQGDKLLVGGAFSGYGGGKWPKQVRPSLIRLLPNSAPDPTFNLGTEPLGDVTSLKVLRGGQILAAGRMCVVQGARRSGIVRFNSDGKLDTSFDAKLSKPVTPASALTSDCGTGGVKDMAVAPDGSIVVVGAFQGYDSRSTTYVHRMNADGSPIAGFKALSLTPPVRNLGYPLEVTGVAIDADGKILISGAFGKVNGRNRPGVARLLPDGTLDNSFTPSFEVVGGLMGVVALSGGRVLAHGSDQLYMLWANGDKVPHFTVPQLNFGPHVAALGAGDRLFLGGPPMAGGNMAKPGIGKVWAAP